MNMCVYIYISVVYVYIYMYTCVCRCGYEIHDVVGCLPLLEHGSDGSMNEMKKCEVYRAGAGLTHHRSVPEPPW